MIARKIAAALLTSGLTLTLLAQSTPSHAILPYFDWRTRSWQHAWTPVVVAPVACSPCATTVCSPCATPCSPCATTCAPCSTTACSPVNCNPCATTCASPVVSYVAETAYRLQVVNTPVTTYQPVITPGPCGTCVTSYMPVTTLVAQTQQVPFTTYRPIYSCAPATCDPCATCPTNCVATADGCSSCASGVATIGATIQDPAVPRLEAPVTPSPAPDAPVRPNPMNGQPTGETPRGEPSPYLPKADAAALPLDTIPSNAPPRRAVPAPLPEVKQDGLTPVAPQLLEPGDKTASLIPAPTRRPARVVNDSGWRAAQ